MTNVDGSNTRRLTHEGNVGAPVWSPDGRTIACGLINQHAPVLLIADVASGNSSHLTIEQISEPWGLTPVKWSPDGRQLLIGATSGYYMLDPERMEIQDMPVELDSLVGVDWFVQP